MASNGVVIAALAIVIVAALYFHNNPPDGKTFGPGDFGDVIVNLFSSNDDEPAVFQPEVIDGRTNICRAYTTNYPTYFELKRVQCGAADGDWVCEIDKAGCFDITSWDYATMCSSAQVQILKALCSSLGGDWSCNAVQVGCQYD